ncbi:class I SAM-dependent DNA methyltransferase [uncultured Deinococcus sp.]|uniref:type I restriction-modification system subunit M n=1 Tax=uncultured Deinococcus sp. TaxID=158789 RepID=UPI0025EDB183|nr:class I SAM-dependent DNA methyltransferase [uncultured Deinococcus sp.]
MAITTLVKSVQDIMRQDTGVDGDAQRISQMVWLIFLKIFDDKEQEWEVTIPGYVSPLQEEHRWSTWAADREGRTGEGLMTFINTDLFPALKAMRGSPDPRAHIVGLVFEDSFNYMKSGTLLRQVVNVIQNDIDFNNSRDRHLFNDIYEKILGDLQSAGNAGEYYTPRAVTQFMVDIIDPRLGEIVLDPACGTGGFLTGTLDHLRPQKQRPEDDEVVQQTVRGIEKKPLPHLLAMTNMLLHGVDVPTNVRHDNTLSRPLRDYTAADAVDIVLANPPFGGVEEPGIGNNFPARYRTRETADLFMALIMQLLKPGTGRAGVVLPDGFLFGEGVKTTIKQELLRDFNLHTIVRLPKGVFSPYTSINTNILFFEKGGPTENIWFFEHPYPEGYKSYSRTRPLTRAEFDREIAWWGGPSRTGREESEYAWTVNAADIAASNYNLDIKNPHHVEVVHGDPAELMAEYQELTEQVQAAQNALKQELMAALGGGR